MEKTKLRQEQIGAINSYCLRLCVLLRCLWNTLEWPQPVSPCCGMLWQLFCEGSFVVQKFLSGEDNVHALKMHCSLPNIFPICNLEWFITDGLFESQDSPLNSKCLRLSYLRTWNSEP